MIELIICIVNLFFIPMIFIQTYWKRNKRQLMLSFELVSCYISMVPILFLITKVFLALIRIIKPIEVHLTSSKYTLVAVLLAFLLPYVIEVFKKYVSVTCEIKKR